jgi:hypothetical protein
VIVGRLDAAFLAEGPEGGPDLEQVACQTAAAFVARRFAGVGAQDRLELSTEQPDPAFEFFGFPGVLVDLPTPEQLIADAESGLAELTLGA